MRIGQYEINAIDAGTFRLDGGSMFGVVPKVMWERIAPPDDKNRILLALRPMLIRGSGRVILCEAGIGDKWTDSKRNAYGISGGGGKLASSLSTFGTRPEDVSDVIVSHLHFDHAGGLTTEQDGRIVLTFPRAMVHIQRKNLEWAKKRNIREQASYLPENIEPIEKAGLMNPLDGPTRLFPGIDVLVADGHTRGMQMTRVSDGSTTLVFAADLIPTRAHVRLPYIMGYDVEAVRTLEEKRAFLAEAAEKKWILFFTHDPNVAACRVTAKDDDFYPGEGVQI